MALMHEMDPSDTARSLSDESKGLPWGENIRDYEPSPETAWRFGRPSYARVNEVYFKKRSKRHEEGSLEAAVSKVVKNWEVESHHISNVKQWKTMDTTKFTASLNGGGAVSAEQMCEIGPYNLFLGETPQYSPGLQTFDTANVLFSNTFQEGFAWEVLEVLSGPPLVTFKWRHFGEFTGEFVDKQGKKHKGSGEMIDFTGMCIARVNEQMVMESLEVFYNPADLLEPLTGQAVPSKGTAAVSSKS
jgi:hypothetical protein